MDCVEILVDGTLVSSQTERQCSLPEYAETLVDSQQTYCSNPWNPTSQDEEIDEENNEDNISIGSYHTYVSRDTMSPELIPTEPVTKAVFVPLVSHPSSSPKISVTNWIKTHFEKETFESDILIHAAYEGTKLHKDIEKYLLRMHVENNSIEFKHFKAFIKDNHLITKMVEWRIYDPIYRLSGCLDALMQDHNGNTWLFDWKRVSRFTRSSYKKALTPCISHISDCNFMKYALQLNTYKYLLKSVHNIDVFGMAIVQLYPSQSSYRVLYVPDLQKVKGII